jgi:phage terminase small subunit
VKNRTLTPRQSRFIDEYLVSLNASAAAILAGYSRKTASDIARQLLRKTPVAAAIKVAIDNRAARTGIEADNVLRQWWEIANANVNDLVSYRRFACRYCFGTNHQFQWRSEREHDAACALAQNEKRQAPSCEGGFGFNDTAAPFPTCPECSGNGVGTVVTADTTQLKGSALLLYDGVEQTRGGLKIKLVDRSKALENVARHLGMFSEKLILKGEPENPLTALLQRGQATTLQPVANPPDDDEDD